MAVNAVDPGRQPLVVRRAADRQGRRAGARGQTTRAPSPRRRSGRRSSSARGSTIPRRPRARRSSGCSSSAIAVDWPTGTTTPALALVGRVHAACRPASAARARTAERLPIDARERAAAVRGGARAARSGHALPDALPGSRPPPGTRTTRRRSSAVHDAVKAVLPSVALGAARRRAAVAEDHAQRARTGAAGDDADVVAFRPAGAEKRGWTADDVRSLSTLGVFGARRFDGSPRRRRPVRRARGTEAQQPTRRAKEQGEGTRG